MPSHSGAAERTEGPSVTARSPAGAGASFEELYTAHFTDLAVQLYAYFGDRQEAQDVVQEAFCRALAR
jgi:DNA-directed RNA polymerase specialized sigma24 family protein